MQHCLCWKAGISSGHAGELVRLANARVSHPLIMETFAEGLLSSDQAAIATKAPVHLDDWFATVAQSATVAQLRTMVRAARTPPLAPDPATVEPPAESLAGWFDDDGRYHLRGELDPDHGRIVDQALTEARDARPGVGVFRAYPARPQIHPSSGRQGSRQECSGA